MSSSTIRLRKWFHWNHFAYLLVLLLINEMIVETWQQIQYEHPDSASQPMEQVEFNYHQGDEHHIVKRKLKMKSILGGGRSKSKQSRPKPQSNPYPKQPAHNPAYSSGSSSNPYPKQPAYNPSYPAGPPPAYPGSSHHSGYPAGPPPPYPGLNSGGSAGGRGYLQQSNYPRYPQQSASYPAQNPYPGCKYCII
mgnify:FL=1